MDFLRRLLTEAEAISSYAGVFALALNLLVSIALTLICAAIGMKRLDDKTRPEDYDEDAVESLTLGSGSPTHVN